VTAACLVIGQLDAKTPPKGGDNSPLPVPGTIIFHYEDDICGMDGDSGSQRRIFPPDFYCAPSSRVYGSVS